MRKLAALTVLAVTLAGPVLAQGRDPSSSSAASGNAEQNNKPTSNSAGGGGGR
ncbi:hypothetical protein [Methylobacterium gnaphalii]|uniref:Uncharacterized protein n=1 Tax=Methylobacterium gnaphalii TaxID=1010610 RepID=A0A512JHF2_9HYPH|nr:hypothetical protein [Methylobacterium gnaphalii]GEP09384.1 hypothetical protein MGN01_12290 [Methylobacterium gnaphalii]GJD68135.1 hypothetical protein MMMDOFMJ_1053 [Methylobacterium gnaphalii]GLS51761.1 hypothetical protein GCM10007885_46220 [Methylobacterium gnaphalii]